MGFFGRFVFADGRWGTDPATPPYLVIDVHDSDIATVDYAPVSDGASGRCFVGFEPRHYFEDESANVPVELTAEARSMASWARHVTGTEVDPADIEGMLASPEGEEPADVFVEETLARLFPLLGLPTPEDLPAD